ncbi:MAG: hypothetical protein EOP11_04940 [Proteobacteria bacterium]|nr:MAG: hypothetical protein EOP11_04940 [Pseudomonadota bacterium]
MQRVLKNESGNFAFSAMVLLALLALAGGAYWAFKPGDKGHVAGTDPMATFEELKLRMQAAMNNQAAVSFSVDRNPNSFSCLFQASGNCQGRGGLFLLYENLRPDGQALSQLMRGAGFNAEGLGCTNFPSETCPLRVEAMWKPVCGGNYCENTRSFQLKASVVLQVSPEAQPTRWDEEKMFSPELKLSAAVTCERGGGAWAGTRCLSGSEAMARGVASRPEGNADMNGYVPTGVAPGVFPEDELICPDHINIQGQLYTLERMPVGRAEGDEGRRVSGIRGQVKTPAMNGCPDYDTFTFQCQQKVPAQFEGEGQWVQVEAQTAPNCHEDQVIDDQGVSGDYSRQ